MMIWKPLPHLGFTVSDDGRVRCLRTGREMKQHRKDNLYLFVSRKEGGRSKTYYVHRLVCEAFHGPCPEGWECDHINYDRADNRAANLRWVTPKENKAHRRHPQGEDRAQAKLSNDDVAVIRTLLPRHSNTEIGRRFGVARRTISDIRNGRTWTNASQASGA